MSDIAESYQEQQAQEPREVQTPSFATVTAVYGDGLGLRFDGENEPSRKHYKCNQYCKFAAGQRVYLVKDGGTFIVLCPVGAPQTPTVSSAESADHADGVSDQNGYLLYFRVISNGLQFRTFNGVGWGAWTNV